MTKLEAKKATCRLLNIEYSDIANNDLFSSEDLDDYLDTGISRAWNYKPWDFSEGAKTATLSSDDITKGYVDYPIEMMSGGAFLLVVNGQEFEDKLVYRDFRRQLQDDSNSQDQIWAEYKRFIFINMNATSAGQSFDVYGKLNAPKLSSDSDLLPFSPDTDDQEDSGNKAIVRFAYADALSSEKKKNSQQAEVEEKKAFSMLDIVWKPFAQLQANQQIARPMLNVPDYFGKNPKNPAYTGNFHYLH